MTRVPFNNVISGSTCQMEPPECHHVGDAHLSEWGLPKLSFSESEKAGTRVEGARPALGWGVLGWPGISTSWGHDFEQTWSPPCLLAGGLTFCFCTTRG